MKKVIAGQSSRKVKRSHEEVLHKPRSLSFAVSLPFDKVPSCYVEQEVKVRIKAVRDAIENCDGSLNQRLSFLFLFANTHLSSSKPPGRLIDDFVKYVLSSTVFQKIQPDSPLLLIRTINALMIWNLCHETPRDLDSSVFLNRTIRPDDMPHSDNFQVRLELKLFNTLVEYHARRSAEFGPLKLGLDVIQQRGLAAITVLKRTLGCYDSWFGPALSNKTDTSNLLRLRLASMVGVTNFHGGGFLMDSFKNNERKSWAIDYGVVQGLSDVALFGSRRAASEALASLKGFISYPDKSFWKRIADCFSATPFQNWWIRYIASSSLRVLSQDARLSELKLGDHLRSRVGKEKITEVKNQLSGHGEIPQVFDRGMDLSFSKCFKVKKNQLDVLIAFIPYYGEKREFRKFFKANCLASHLSECLKSIEGFKGLPVSSDRVIYAGKLTHRISRSERFSEEDAVNVVGEIIPLLSYDGAKIDYDVIRPIIRKHHSANAISEYIKKASTVSPKAANGLITQLLTGHYPSDKTVVARVLLGTPYESRILDPEIWPNDDPDLIQGVYKIFGFFDDDRMAKIRFLSGYRCLHNRDVMVEFGQLLKLSISPENKERLFNRYLFRWDRRTPWDSHHARIITESIRELTEKYKGPHLVNSVLERMFVLDNDKLELNWIEERLTQLLNIEDVVVTDRESGRVQFDVLDEIALAVSLDHSEWSRAFRGIQGKVSSINNPEKPLEDVRSEFLLEDTPLSEDVLDGLIDEYKRILECYQEYGYHRLTGKEAFQSQLADIRQLDSEEDKKIRYLALIRRGVQIDKEYLPYNTQMIVALAMINSDVNLLAQVKTGQGKSVIVAILAAYWGVQMDGENNKRHTIDIVTTSNCLAIRDAKDMRPFFEMLGLTVTHCCDKDQTYEKNFDADIVYGTPYHFESAELHQAIDFKETRGRRPYDKVIVDEVDSLFIDKLSDATTVVERARCFHSISWIYPILGQLCEENPEISTASIVERLRCELQNRPQIDSWTRNFLETRLSVLAESAKKFQRLCEGKEYVVSDRKILLMDYRNTGEVQKRRVYTGGTHQLLELKHGLFPTDDHYCSAAKSHLSLFKGYRRIYGLSGTLGSTVEREEIDKTYGVKTFDVPVYKKGELERETPIICEDEDHWLKTLCVDIREKSQLGRSVLALLETVRETKLLADRLLCEGLQFQVLTGLEEKGREERILRKAGQERVITIATNVAGRGTDIRTSEIVEEKGGQYVIIGFYPINIRVQNQAEGRTARQGKRGSVQMILNKQSFRSLGVDLRLDSNSMMQALEEARRKYEERESFLRLNVYSQFSQLTDEMVRTMSRLFYEVKESNDALALDSLRSGWQVWFTEYQRRIDAVGGELNVANVPENLARYRSEFDDLLGQLKRDMRDRRVHHVEDYVAQANQFLSERNFSAGIQLVNKMLQEFPNESMGYWILSKFCELGEQQNAPSADVKPKNPGLSAYITGTKCVDTPVGRFNVHEAWKKALECSEKALVINPFNLQEVVIRLVCLKKCIRYGEVQKKIIPEFKKLVSDRFIEPCTRANIFLQVAEKIWKMGQSPGLLEYFVEAVEEIENLKTKPYMYFVLRASMYKGATFGARREKFLFWVEQAKKLKPLRNIEDYLK